MISPLSHDSRMIRHQNASAAVNVFAAEIGANITLAVLSLPAKAKNVTLVNGVLRYADIAKVAKSVVPSVMVDMVNNIRLFVMSKKPSNAMSEVHPPLKLNVMVSPGLASVPSGSVGLDCLRGRPDPQKLSGGRAVSEVVADRIWYKFCSHAESPLSVVRGLVVGATSAPILARGLV